jgi:hypothetical protein
VSAPRMALTGAGILALAFALAWWMAKRSPAR